VVVEVASLLHQVQNSEVLLLADISMFTVSHLRFLPKERKPQAGSSTNFSASFSLPTSLTASYKRKGREEWQVHSLPPNVTMEEKGVKTVSIRGMGNKKARMTVMLSLLADGCKLLP
jgi:hypothetical protein